MESNTIKVLVADDDPPTRILLKAAISQWGYQVIEATDGEDAWTLIQEKNPPDLLILDWLMPRLDGIELCKRIKDSSISTPYIILLTQISGTPNIIRGLEAGADEFLSKPFNMAELRSRLAVGARVVNHQHELRNYVVKVDELIAKILTVSLQISTLSAEMENLQKLPEQQTNLNKISHLNATLTELIENLRKFNLSHK